jgi:hypothetical protein
MTWMAWMALEEFFSCEMNSGQQHEHDEVQVQAEVGRL